MNLKQAILLLAVIALPALAILPLLGCGSEPYTIDEEKGERPRYKTPKDSAKISERTEKDTATARMKVYPKRKPKKYIVRTYPQFTLQFTAGYNLGIAELTASTDNVSQIRQFENGENFGVRRGFGVMVSGKLPLQAPGNLRITFNGGFNMFSNNKFYSTVSTDGHIKYYLTSLGFGLENSFTPSFRIKPYLNIAALANVIWGKADYIGPTDVDGRPLGNLGPWEASGIVDASEAFGPGMFLITVQAHTLWVEKAAGEDNNSTPAGPDFTYKREGGQLLLIKIPGL